ncbi:hypothetical protein BH09ACT12_BH09ACT12_08090 [soil metagenome]
MSSSLPGSTRARSSRQRVRLAAFALALGVLLVGGAAVVVAGLQSSLGPETQATSGVGLPSAAELGTLPELPPQVRDSRAPLRPGFLRRDIDYVALGDSYSAGPGLAPQRSDPAECQRSGSNWPAYLAGWLDVSSYRDVTCAGATTGALLLDQPRPSGSMVPPQLQALSPETDLVTVSLGGNDNALFMTLVGTCSELAQEDPDGDPCRSTYSDDGSEARALDEVPVHLAVVIRRIRLTAPGAQVVVVGYPQIFPAGGTCDAVSLATGDVAWAAGVVESRNSAMESAARDEGVRFVDVADASSGHDVCSDEPWVTGSEGAAGATEPWHPGATGMREVARIVAAQLTGSVVADVVGPPDLADGVTQVNESS